MLTYESTVSILLIFKLQQEDNMSNQLIGYVRVSTREQSTGRQTDYMEPMKLNKIFIDKLSGKSKERPELRNCIDYARNGDVLYIYSIDRLARNLSDLQELIKELTEKGVTVQFIKENQTYSKDTSNPLNTVMLHLLGAFAEFERNIMLERQAEGIAHAKANGTKSGKPFGKQPLDQSLKPKAIELFTSGENITQIAKELKISRASVYKLLEGQTRTVQY
jgi:DNA invertase Pin-like site-specific DNA recombinase